MLNQMNSCLNTFYVSSGYFLSLQTLKCQTSTCLLATQFHRCVLINDVLCAYVQMGCKASLVIFNYFIMANFYWLLVEGLYLHTLLMVIFSENKHFIIYLLIGWGESSLEALTLTFIRHFLPPKSFVILQNDYKMSVSQSFNAIHVSVFAYKLVVE